MVVFLKNFFVKNLNSNDIFIDNINKNYYYTINDYKIKEEKPNETISIEVPNTSTDNGNYNILSLILPTYLIVKKKFS